MPMSTGKKGGPAARKDPEGGLTDAGRAFYAKTEGARLEPGVTKRDAEMAPEDMKRKGSFLRRHFANPRGPMLDDQGRPTRLALSAHAWGETPPKDEDGARTLADEGSRYLEKYREAKAKAKAEGGDEPARPRSSGAAGGSGGSGRPSAGRREKRG
jgi:hypothetical protein